MRKVSAVILARKKERPLELPVALKRIPAFPVFLVGKRSSREAKEPFEKESRSSESVFYAASVRVYVCVIHLGIFAYSHSRRIPLQFSCGYRPKEGRMWFYEFYKMIYILDILSRDVYTRVAISFNNRINIFHPLFNFIKNSKPQSGQ